MEEKMATLRLILNDIEDQKIAIKENGKEAAKTVTDNMNLILDDKLNINVKKIIKSPRTKI